MLSLGDVSGNSTLDSYDELILTEIFVLFGMIHIKSYTKHSNENDTI